MTRTCRTFFGQFFTHVCKENFGVGFRGLALGGVGSSAKLRNREWVFARSDEGHRRVGVRRAHCNISVKVLVVVAPRSGRSCRKTV